MFNFTYSDALAKAEHLKALGQTTIYLHCGLEEFPFDQVTRVEEGSSWRLNGPASCYLIAEASGLTFKVNVDFEERDANGKGVSMFDRDKLRDIFSKLPPAGRRSFADLLETKCLQTMADRTKELRAALNAQADSENVVRELVAFARQKEAA